MVKPKVDDMKLSDKEKEDGLKREREVQWHPYLGCMKCGDRVFYDYEQEIWLCRSWLYMEGGC